MTTTKKYPAAVYAAAGAGELAYRQLRKLADRLTAADIDKVRAAARRNAVAVLDEARGVYADLVARGEKVVASESVKRAERASDAAGGIVASESVKRAAVEATPAPVKRARSTTAGK